MAANATAILTVKLRDLVSGPAKGIRGAFGKIGKSLEGVRKPFGLAGSIGFAATAVNQLGQQARGALTSILGPAIQFEDTMARVGALTSDISIDNMKRLTATAREMGRTTRFTAQEAAEGLIQLAIAGYKTTDQIKALPAVLKLTQASGSEMGRVADIVSDLMGAFGKSAEDTGEIAGTLAATFSNSTTTLETLYETMKYGAAVGTKAGVSMKTLFLMTGLVGNAGIKGSMAGTALVNIISKLVGAGKKGAGALRSLGLSGKDIEKGLSDPLVLLNRINEAFEFKKYSRARRLKELTKIFGTRGSQLATIVTLMDEMGKVGEGGETAYERLTAAIDDSTSGLDRMSKIVDSTQLASIKRLDSAVESLKIDLAEKLAPTFAPLVEDVNKLVGQFAGWAKENPAVVSTLGKVLIGLTAFSAVFGPLLLTLSSLVSTWAVFRGALVLGSAPMRIAAGALRGLNASTNRAIDGMVKMTGVSTKMATAMKLIKGAVGVVGAAFAGWEVGKYLDKAIGKMFKLREGLLSTEIALQAAESDTMSNYLQDLGEFYGISSLTEAAKKNKEINRERAEVAAEAKRFKQETKTSPIEKEEDRKVVLEVGVSDERTRVRTVKAGKKIEARVGSNVSQL